MSAVILPASQLRPDHVGLRCSTGVPRTVTWSEEGLRDSETQRLLNPTLGWQITEVQDRSDGDIDLFLHALSPEDHGVSDILVTLRPHDCVWIEETPIQRLHTEVGKFLQDRHLSHHQTRIEVWELDEETNSWDLTESVMSAPWPELSV